MESSTPLFRPAALAARRHDAHGEIVLARPLSATLLSVAVGSIALGLVAFAYFGRYTAHQTLPGRVVPEQRVLDVVSPQVGALIDVRVTEGQSVAAGDVLFSVSNERQSSAGGATRATVAAQLERRRASLAAQIESTRALERAESEALGARRAALEREVAALRSTVGVQRERVAFAAATAERYARMRAEGYVSEEHWDMKQAELLEQRGRLQALDRERASSARLAAELDGRAAALGLEYDNRVAELERAIVATERELAENEAERASVVTAAQAGTVTAVAGVLGQAVERGTVLAALVPAGAPLAVELFAPSRAVGFIVPGDSVRLRYAAFPYQKFGHARGTVAAISATGVGGDARAAVASSSREPVYVVTVVLESQTVNAYGEPRRLLPAMLVEADVLLETRRLYEWVFEPLYALARRTAE